MDNHVAVEQKDPQISLHTSYSQSTLHNETTLDTETYTLELDGIESKAILRPASKPTQCQVESNRFYGSNSIHDGSVKNLPVNDSISESCRPDLLQTGCQNTTYTVLFSEADAVNAKQRIVTNNDALEPTATQGDLINNIQNTVATSAPNLDPESSEILILEGISNEFGHNERNLNVSNINATIRDSINELTNIQTMLPKKHLEVETSIAPVRESIVNALTESFQLLDHSDRRATEPITHSSSTSLQLHSDLQNLLKCCNQKTPYPLSKILHSSFPTVKIGEATYSDVYQYSSDSENTAIKVIPLDGNDQLSIQSALIECRASLGVSRIRKCVDEKAPFNYVNMKKMSVGAGVYDGDLLRIWEEYDQDCENGSENVHPGTRFILVNQRRVFGVADLSCAIHGFRGN